MDDLRAAASLLGRHALPVYCFGSVLSAVGQILNETQMASPFLDVCLSLSAAVLERRSVRAWLSPDHLFEDLQKEHVEFRDCAR